MNPSETPETTPVEFDSLQAAAQVAAGVLLSDNSPESNLDMSLDVILDVPVVLSLEVGRTRIVVCQPSHGRDAILRRDSGRGAVLVIDRDGECGSVRRVVLGDHRREAQAVRGLGGQRRADDAAGVADDEGHLLGRGVHCGEHEIALVLAVVVVGDDHDLAASEGLDGGCHALLGVGHQAIDPLL